MIIIIIQDHAAYITDFIGGAQAGLGCERQSRILLDKGKCKIVNLYLPFQGDFVRKTSDHAQEIPFQLS